MTQYLITTEATPHRCGRCGAWTLTGHAEGVLVHADPVPLDEREEFNALVDGRPTYNLHAEAFGRRHYLAQRTAVEIAAPRRCVVLTAHRCGQPIGIMPAPPPVQPSPPDDAIPF